MKTQHGRSLSLALVLFVVGIKLWTIEKAMGAGFVSVSPMNRARNYYTATLLPNGQVLVAGGFNLGTSAELYDPATDTWTVTGSRKGSGCRQQSHFQ